MKWPNTYLFIAISLISVFLYLLTSHALNLDKVFVLSLSEQLTSEQVQKILFIRKKWQWVQYAFIPLFFGIKISIVAFLLDIGCLFHNKEIPYRQLFRIVLLSEFIFLLAPILKLCWFYFFQSNFTLEDLQYFYPLSLGNIIDHKTVASWLVYPLQVVNVFEVAYFLFLSIQIDKAIGSTTEEGLNIAGCSYGIGLLLWVVSVMFLTLNIS
ncbi:hypothetical protein HMPREF1154_2607 [Capnocytophaga sp. CM59]|jgi:hypothetical protein|nr:hypothetical protein HMPREF1154_2607 [Capnocytophaga sp. CM59]